MEEVLVPLYMHHPYQVTSTASSVGGMHYIYALRGDGRTPVEPVSGADQRAACQSLLATLEPAALSIPQSVLASLPPRPAGYGRTRKLFPRYTGLMFDAISPAVVASDHTISEILQPDRAARLVEQHALDPALPGLEDVITGLLEASAAKAGDSQGRDTEGRAEGGDRSTDGPAWWSSHASGQSSRDGLSGARAIASTKEAKWL